MFTARMLNTAGLIVGMVGVILIFFWGPLQPTLEEGVGFGLELGTVLEDGRTVAQHDEDVRALRAKHNCISRIGLGLVFLGFALQLWGTWS